MAASESAVLVLALLTVESSYSREIEQPTTGVPDTVQFWLASDTQWRIKTLAIDHDIHVYQLGDAGSAHAITPERAEVNIRRSYGDVIHSIKVIHFAQPHDAEASARTLRESGLSGALEMAAAGFAFYNPDGGRYSSQSRPKQ
jgi:hypothetical protein